MSNRWLKYDDPCHTTNTANHDTSYDEELARFTHELFRNEAEATNTMTAGSGGDNQANGLSVNTAVPISTETTTSPPYVNHLTPPQPQQMERYVHDDPWIHWCDDCRVDGCCCNLTQFSVLMYCPVFAGMEAIIWIASMHFGYKPIGLVLTIGTIMIWIVYSYFFLRLAGHSPEEVSTTVVHNGNSTTDTLTLKPSQRKDGCMDGGCCVCIQLGTAMFCPLFVMLGMGALVIYIDVQNTWAVGIGLMLGGQVVWMVYLCYFLHCSGCSRISQHRHGRWEWTGEAWELVETVGGLGGDSGGGDGGGGGGGE